LLAFLARPDLDRLLERIDFVQARASNPDRQGARLLAELEHVRRTGVAVNDEELEKRALRAIAAPRCARAFRRGRRGRQRGRFRGLRWP